MSEPKTHAGLSECPMCGRMWWVTPVNDCSLPACGCYGNDTSAANQTRPCEPCGWFHFTGCDKRRKLRAE